MRDTTAAKNLLYRRLRCLADYEAANRALEKARAKNKDVHAVSCFLLLSGLISLIILRTPRHEITERDHFVPLSLLLHLIKALEVADVSRLLLSPLACSLNLPDSI